jgi:hypothetical protein
MSTTKLPLRELLSSEQRKIVNAWLHGFDLERYNERLKAWGLNKEVTANTLDLYGIYRIKAVADQIDWNQVGLMYNCLATDADNRSVLYGQDPTKVSRGWIRQEGDDVVPIPATAFASFQRGTKPWDEEIVKRPGFVPLRVQPTFDNKEST